MKSDGKSKLIATYEVADASVHDSQPTEALLRDSDTGQPLYADSAYTGEPIANMLQNKGIDGKIIFKGYRGHQLTDAHKSVNQVLSKVRVRVEHIFGFVTQNMNDFYLFCIGIKRSTGQIGLINLTYSLCRYEQIMRLNLLPIKQQG